MKNNEKGHTLMFNMIGVGQKISKLRKEANLTQMELADKLDISFQAVSNWERGNTMPDISKLSELSEIFDVSIDELLENKRASKISQSILDDDVKIDDITVEELEELAPLIKPDKLTGIAQDVKKDMDIGDVVHLAPFLSQEFVDGYASEIIKSIENVKELCSLAPFISTSILDELALEIIEEKGLRGIVSIAPFLTRDLIDSSAKKAIDGSGSLSSIACIAPFVSKELINSLAIEAIKTRGLSGISSILPFIDTKILEEYLTNKGK